MLSDSRGPEENPALAGLLAIIRRISTLGAGGGVLFSSESIFSLPHWALRKANRGGYEKQYPAGACRAICLSFRALSGIS